MDIIDILMARKAAQGQAATIMTQAQAALQEASDAADSITSMSSAIETYGEQAQSAYERATAAADIYDNLIAITDQSMIADLAALLSEQMLDTTISSIEVSNGTVEGATTKNIVATKYGGNTTTLEVERNYTTTGQNTDGSMTQKAITDALQSAQVNLGSGNSDKLVKVGSNGGLVVSSIDEDDILNGNIHVDPTNPDTPEEEVPMNNGILGLHLNYVTSTYTPTDDAVSASTIDFSSYTMYGGRKRCLVDDNGTIIAFYGDNNYTDTPTNGYQVMVYQPKFYYKRTPTLTTNNNRNIVQEDIIKISASRKEGFTLHPAFINADGQELDYILLSAYEGSIDTVDGQTKYKDIAYNNFINQKLASVSNAKPISTYTNTLNPATGEQIAQNRGNNWHLMTSKIYSLEQMLQMIEAKRPEVQSIFGRGIVDINRSESSSNISLTGNTGATSQNGNEIVSVSETTFDKPEGATIKNEDGKSSINYRGVENPYGNAWKILGDMLLNNGTLYICNNFNYSTDITNDYVSSQLTTPTITGWISGFGYNSAYDWLFLPVSAQDNADELGPIGDIMCIQNTNGPQVIGIGGGYLSQSRGGIFCFDARRSGQNLGLKTYTVRLVYIPHTSDSNYQSNIAKWRLSIGG